MKILKDGAGDKITVERDTHGDIWVKFYEGSRHVSMLFEPCPKDMKRLRQFRKALKRAEKVRG